MDKHTKFGLQVSCLVTATFLLTPTIKYFLGFLFGFISFLVNAPGFQDIGFLMAVAIVFCVSWGLGYVYSIHKK